MDSVSNQGVLVEVLQSLGIHSWRLSDKGHSLIKVGRPEGVILSALLGAFISPVSPMGRELNLSLRELIRSINMKPVQSPIFPHGEAVSERCS